MTNYTDDPAALYRWRDEMADLIEQKHNGLVKVITNLRRVGKSFLLFNLFKRHLLENVQVASFSAP